MAAVVQYVCECGRCDVPAVQYWCRYCCGLRCRLCVAHEVSFRPVFTQIR